MIRVRVDRVTIAPMSTVGIGYGADVETGERVRFAGDHRPMRRLGEALQRCERRDELPIAEVPEWAVQE